MIRIEQILDKVGRNHPQADLDVLRRAYFFSARHHEGQTRASGEPYLVHPLEVANILADMKLDEVSVATGRLHDVRTLQHLKPEKRRRIAQETLDIFAPIAHRLGMGRLRGELEDLAFKHLHPEEYRELAEQLERRRKEHEAFLADVTSRIQERMRETDVPFISVEGRVKRLYSIHKKLKRQKIQLDQVYDLIAARIITPDESRFCYAALGVVHTLWQPIPGRFKDWIATPRDNLYRSLHTSVMGTKGQPFEIQIRTEEMHRVAEEGVAAHWKYKEGKRGRQDEDEALDTLRKKIGR